MSGMPPLNRALLARMEELLGTYEKMRAGVADVRARVREVTGSASSGDGGVKVTVDQHGALTALEIDARTYRRSSPTELADTILELAAKANREARAKSSEILRPFLPNDVSFDDIVDGTADISIMPAAPLTEENFDGWWAGIGRPSESD